MRESVLNRLVESQSNYLPAREYSKVVQTLASFTGRYGSTEAYLVYLIDRYTGAVRVLLRTVSNRLEEVWDAIGGHPGDGYDVAVRGYFEPLLAELRG
ncbi:MAG: hypothetical protein M3122_09005 [Actinomycetota bacterium]|nr:hypothetical protein [Actinomycetota bacterium]